jgi:uncharacterized protein YbbK (DUF523 family)
MIPKVGISACLLGRSVRWDGGHKDHPQLVERLSSRMELVPVCPEVEAGLGVPRDPIAFAGDRLRVVRTGEDITERMRLAAEKRCLELEGLGLAGFVFKARSPSCGLRDVPAAGRGLFAGAFAARNPDLPVADEEELKDPAALADFIKRVIAR